MAHLARELERAVAAWRERGWPLPQVAVVSGSGLAVDLPGERLGEASLADLLPFPVHAVVGHPHRVEILRVPSGPVVAYFRGRLHAYQGYQPAEVVFPIRLAAFAGVRTLLLTNAAGGLHPHQRAGDLVAIVDHLNLTGLTPLLGEVPSAWGPRFPDLLDAYDPQLRQRARQHANELGLQLADGVYAGLLGPSYETPAEVRMLRALGADMVGMSTVLEVIAARHLGLRCLGISLISNPGAGVAGEPLTHEEVLAAGSAAADRIRSLLAALLADPTLLAGGPVGSDSPPVAAPR